MSAETVAELVGGVEVMAREVVAQRDRAERAEARLAKLESERAETDDSVLDEVIAKLERGLKIEGRHEKWLLSVALDRRDLLTRAERAEAEVARHVTNLAECYRIAGADPDGNTDAMLAQDAVRAVMDLRRDYDQACEDDHNLRAEVARLRAALVSAEPEGEVVWEYRTSRGVWAQVTPATAVQIEAAGHAIRAIRVIATTTKGV